MLKIKMFQNVNLFKVNTDSFATVHIAFLPELNHFFCLRYNLDESKTRDLM